MAIFMEKREHDFPIQFRARRFSECLKVTGVLIIHPSKRSDQTPKMDPGGQRERIPCNAKKPMEQSSRPLFQV